MTWVTVISAASSQQPMGLRRPKYLRGRNPDNLWFAGLLGSSDLGTLFPMASMAQP